jgi:hypothetical protein
MTGNDQIGLSRIGKSRWMVVPSKNPNDNQFNYYVDKLTWCVKNNGVAKNTPAVAQNIVSKYIKFAALQVFK